MDFEKNKQILKLVYDNFIYNFDRISNIYLLDNIYTQHFTSELIYGFQTKYNKRKYILIFKDDSVNTLDQWESYMNGIYFRDNSDKYIIYVVNISELNEKNNNNINFIIKIYMDVFCDFIFQIEQHNALCNIEQYNDIYPYLYNWYTKIQFIKKAKNDIENTYYGFYGNFYNDNALIFNNVIQEYDEVANKIKEMIDKYQGNDIKNATNE